MSEEEGEVGDIGVGERSGRGRENREREGKRGGQMVKGQGRREWGRDKKREGERKGM